MKIRPIVKYLYLLSLVSTSINGKPHTQILARRTVSEIQVPSLPKTDHSDVIIFFNSNHLHGSILSLSYPNGIKFKLDNSNDKTIFQTKNIKCINLAIPSKKQNPKKSTSTITLTNEDKLIGNILELNKKSLILDTWYAGIIKIKYQMLKHISQNKNNTNKLYTGPNNLKEWTILPKRNNIKAWKYKNGFLYCDENSSNKIIGKNINLPDMAKISFTVENKDHLCLTFQFYSDEISISTTNSYKITISQYVNITRCTATKNSYRESDIQSFHSKYIKDSGKKDICILIDKINKKFYLLCNGKIEKQWTDAQKFAGTGKYICFSNRGGKVKISNIKVEKWDGKFKITKTKNINNQVTADLLQFKNGDKIKGEIINIKDKILYFKTSYATLTIPMTRINNITLNSKTQENRRKKANDIKAIFHNNNHLTIELVKADNKTIKAKSENFGTITIIKSAFKRLYLNIYDKRNKK